MLKVGFEGVVSEPAACAVGGVACHRPPELSVIVHQIEGKDRV